MWQLLTTGDLYFGRPKGRPRTQSDYISGLAWEQFGVTPEELVKVVGEMSVSKQLKLLSHNLQTGGLCHHGCHIGTF